MEAKAVGRYLRVTLRKAKYVLDAVRGKSANEALAMLKFIPNEAAKYIRQVVESAVANAEHNYAMDREILRICRAYADQGPSMKRIQPRAMGRAYRILKRMSHITVVVTEDETLRKAAKPKGKPAVRHTKGTAEIAAAEPKTSKKKAAKPKPEAKTEKVVEESAVPVEIEAAETTTVETETTSAEEQKAETAETSPEPAEEQKEE